VRPSVHKSFENHRPCVHASISVVVNTIFGGVSPANFYSSPTSTTLTFTTLNPVVIAVHRFLSSSSLMAAALVVLKADHDTVS